MKQLFLKILKALFYFTLIALIILIIFGIALILDWPLWVGFFMLIGLIGLLIAFILLRKIWLRQKEKLFVQQVVAQDEAYLKGLAEKERDQLKQLQDRWKESVEALKHSHLRKYGNPLYVLPWYLIIGESGSGKTTAIKSARLSSAFAETKQVSGISGTRNCDWWFFEQAIIIDTAGRYAIPIDESKDKEEWQNFLNLLAKYRKRESLNGLIVTIAASKLLEERPEVLEEDGRTIRRRINELMRVLGAKPPIYVLITKCDLIQGMTQFCTILPEKSLNQAMGFINHDLASDVGGFLEKSFNRLVDHLRDYRLLLLHQSDSPTVDPGLLLFPEELENMKRGLELFIKEAFQENPYQETQLLRGIFFSSGRQEGSPFSHFLNALGLIGEKEVLAGTSKGLFLHDFFSKIIPKDRNLFAPTRLAAEWKRITRNLALTAWIAIGLAICGLLSFSFVMNMKTLRGFSREIPPSTPSDTILTEIVNMDRFRQGILKAEAQNRSWWIPKFGLYESKDVEIKLKERYVRQFQKGLLNPLDEQMAKNIPLLSKSTSAQDLGKNITYLIQRINILKAYKEGNNFEQLPQPDYENLLRDKIGIVPEMSNKFATLYLYYLKLHPDSSDINREINRLQSWLKDILTEKDMSFQWLVTWMNNQKSLSEVSLEDFWDGSLPLKNKIIVLPAFTSKGKELIDSFIHEIESALPDPGPPMIAKQKSNFNQWYYNAYFNTWYDFGTAFPEGIDKFKGKDEWKQIASKMPTEQGPYFGLLERMAVEIEPLANQEQKPSWVDLLYTLQDVITQASQESEAQEKGFLEKTAQKGRRLFKKLEETTGQVDKKRLQSEARAIKAYQVYKNALTELIPIATSRNLAYQTLSQMFSEDPEASKIPFYTAYKAITEIKNSLVTVGTEQRMVWILVTGPFDYFLELAHKETACYLQNKWDETVLAEIQNMPESTAAYEILKKEGYAWKYVKGPAASFISWDRRKGHYYAIEVLGKRLPFNNPFLSFLTEGATTQPPPSQSYKVEIVCEPTSANPEAQIPPDATHLELKCSDGVQSIDNYNYPCRKVFQWGLDKCDTVTLTIDIGNYKFIKEYTGYYAFPNFLNDFKGGKRIFSRNEFPDQISTLERLGIQYIEVKYRFSGHKPIIDLLNTPKQVPRNILTCWDY